MAVVNPKLEFTYVLPASGPILEKQLWERSLFHQLRHIHVFKGRWYIDGSSKFPIDEAYLTPNENTRNELKDFPEPKYVPSWNLLETFMLTFSALGSKIPKIYSTTLAVGSR